MNNEYQTQNAHALKGQHNLAQRQRPGELNECSARGIALNMQYRMFNAHALKGQHNLARGFDVRLRRELSRTLSRTATPWELNECSARGIALNMQFRMFKAHALKGQYNLAQGIALGIRNEEDIKRRDDRAK